MNRVLIAEDDEPMRALLARALSDASTEVVTADGGRRALELIDEDPFDLLLLDVHMPEMDGWRVLASVRSHAAARLMPVIVVTGDAAREVEGLDRGADDFLPKPFCPRELAARARALLRRHRLTLSANPLTGLPGNPAIEEEIGRRLAAGESFALFHADLDRFKQYNDAFGFAQGNQVLRDTAEILRRCAGPGFIGHIGGDDFAVVLDAADAALAAQRMTSLFDTLRPDPCLTLSIGIASTQLGPIKCYAHAAALAGEMKRYVKARRVNGLSAFSFDRRRRFE